MNGQPRLPVIRANSGTRPWKLWLGVVERQVGGQVRGGVDLALDDGDALGGQGGDALLGVPGRQAGVDAADEDAGVGQLVEHHLHHVARGFPPVGHDRRDPDLFGHELLGAQAANLGAQLVQAHAVDVGRLDHVAAQHGPLAVDAVAHLALLVGGQAVDQPQVRVADLLEPGSPP